MSASLERMRDAMRRDGVDDKAARRNLFWARAFLEHAGSDEPDRLGRRDLDRFLAHLANDRYAGRPAQDRALNAIRLLYRRGVGRVPAWLQIVLDERRPVQGPNIVSRDEVGRLLAQLHGAHWLAAALVYSTGIRLIECVRLRIRDIDLGERTLQIRDARDAVLRDAALPESILAPLEQRIEGLRRRHIREVGDGRGRASLPPDIAEERPELARKWGWQYLFPQRREGEEFRPVPDGEPVHHVEPAQMHRHIEQAAQAAGIHRRVTGHVLRNSYAIHLIQQGVPVRRVEQLLGTAPDDLPACTRDDPPVCLELPAARTANGLSAF